MTNFSADRRDFLNSFMPQSAAGDAVMVPVGASTVRIATRAMACEFGAALNPGSHESVSAVSDALEMVHEIEGWLSIYRSTSEMSQVNREAATQEVRVRPELMEILQLSRNLFERTGGAFDIAAGAQVSLWRRCRQQQRIPTEHEIKAALAASGSEHLELNSETGGVRFGITELQLDPGAIGKGYALDQLGDWLSPDRPRVPHSFLLHGGRSSVLARGSHNELDGWPVGLGNPLFTNRRLGTVLLKNQAMATSGSNIQFFRCDGRRYGHILDPRTAMPVDGMLSVTVLAESAALADALSTAFFVLGVENAQKCCDNLENVSVILIPFPDGKRVRPVLLGVPLGQIFWDDEQVVVPG
ncbi:MAG: FAD:protein FMN transferase [Planctomycetaceae bacterium]|nr:FAD:protein FMN transferase [Planctomycetaceae bacterium]